MAKIHVLEKHIAELIAAGEVVERPASAVKELLENAIDAGSSQITVTIESGGIRLIEISDNGTGIETEYISTAFIRHATSKIQYEEDLNAIKTLGFRGEALASIATVAKVEVLTKTQDDEFACSYRIEGGQEIGMEVSARAIGTTIRVRDLFYNTPARMKFLKKDASEGTFVADLVGHVALSHPEISFKFVREGKLQYVTPGDGDLQSAAYAVLGREFARDLVKVAQTSDQYSITGYISPPKNCRASRGMQYFYINGRYVKNRTMMVALETAYKGTLMHGKFPGCVLNLQMPVDLIDVNVHPSKTEVRFVYEKQVFEAVYRAVKSALAQASGDMRLFSFGNTAEPQAANTSASPTIEPDSTVIKTDVLSKKSECVAPLYGSKSSASSAQNETENCSDETTVGAVSLDQVPSTASATSASYTASPVTIINPNAPIMPQVQMRSPSIAQEEGATKEPLQESLQRETAQEEPLKPAFAPTKMNDAMLDIMPEVEESGKDDFSSQTDDLLELPPLQLSRPIATATVAEDAAKYVTEPVAEEEKAVQETEQISFEIAQEEPLRYLGEAFKTYIIAQQGDALCMIDKHAAHERMLYETLVASYGNVASQMLLQAVTVNLSASEKQALLENMDLLEDAGIELDDFGGTTVLVRAVPSDVMIENVEDLIVELAAKLVSGNTDAISAKTDWVLHSISCRAAIKAGDQSNAQQLLHLAQRILSGEIPPYCPHGRPCVITITRKDLEKKFGRIV